MSNHKCNFQFVKEIGARFAPTFGEIKYKFVCECGRVKTVEEKNEQ